MVDDNLEEFQISYFTGDSDSEEDTQSLMEKKGKMKISNTNSKTFNMEVVQ